MGIHPVIEPPPRLRLRRSHPSWPGGAIVRICQVCYCPDSGGPFASPIPNGLNAKKPRTARISIRAVRGLLSYADLTSQRIRPDLEFDFLALGAFSAFDVPHKVGSVVGPHCAVFP